MKCNFSTFHPSSFLFSLSLLSFHFFLFSPFLSLLLFQRIHVLNSLCLTLTFLCCPSFSGSILTRKTYSTELSCSGTESTNTYTMSACVATTATSSSKSLGYYQWTYATPITAPRLTGYAVLSSYSLNFCTTLKSIDTFKLNECLTSSNGDHFIETISEIPFVGAPLTYTTTSYSDSLCQSVMGTPSTGVQLLDDCEYSQNQIDSVQSTAFQLTSETPMVMLRYFSRLILPL